MDDFVKVVGCNAWSDFSAYDVQDFAGESAGFAHGVLACFIKDCDFVFAEKSVFWIAIFRPYRLGYVVRYRSSWR